MSHKVHARPVSTTHRSQVCIFNFGDISCNGNSNELCDLDNNDECPAHTISHGVHHHDHHRGHGMVRVQ